jgi:hypothetical protein
MDAFMLPLMGSVTLMFAKLTSGDTARWAERQFLAALLVITIATIRTVILCDENWLLHTATLGTIIIAALIVPGSESTVLT